MSEPEFGAPSPGNDRPLVEHRSSAGGSLLVWPALFWSDPARLAEAFRAALDAGPRAGMKFAQLLLPEADADQAPAAIEAGFQRLTQIVRMQAYVFAVLRNASPHSPLPEATLQWRECAFESADTLKETLAKTYIGSLDLPEIHHWRTLDETLESHRSQSEAGPADWWILAVESRPAGVLLLAGDRETPTLEIAYVGLVPECRGQGLGNLLIRQAADRARALGFETISVNLDVRNAPAQRLYSRWRFDEIGRYELLIARMNHG